MKKYKLGLRPGHIAVVALCLAVASPAIAIPVYTGGTGGISFGVAPYGAPQPGIPTYIANNFTGRVDILTSPGGTFQTASPVIANNTSSSGIVALPRYQFQFGGGNVHGAFGAGEVLLTGTAVGFALEDSNPAGGSASYAVASAISSFTNAVAYNGPFGTYLAIAGELPVAGTAGVAAIRTHITSPNAASPFFGIAGAGIELPELVLANSRGVGPTYSGVAIGGTTGTKAALILDNGALGLFRGIAINNLSFNIPAGDTFTAVSTLTVYADPMAIDLIDPFDPFNADLLTAAGDSLPSESPFGFAQVPEPNSLVLASIGCVLLVRKRRRKS